MTARIALPATARSDAAAKAPGVMAPARPDPAVRTAIAPREVIARPGQVVAKVISAVTTAAKALGARNAESR
jgi:hypothetical protein